MNADVITLLLTATVQAGTPILFATLGAIVVERAGVNQLGVEGLMLIGALAGFAALHYTQSLMLAVLAAFIFSGAAGGIHAFISVTLKGNQIVSGLALTMFGVGITAMFGKTLVAKTNPAFSTVEIPLLSKIPVIGQPLFNQDMMIYGSYVLVALLWFFFSRTRWGLYVRTAGENPAAADTSGINVQRVRFWATVAGSGISGLGGAYLSLFYIPFWTENMTAGRGWIAVALVIFTGWSTNRAILGAYFFGGITALQLRFQALGATISPQFLNMLPYVCTIMVLTFSAMRKRYISRTPKSLGVPYDREGRN